MKEAIVEKVRVTVERVTRNESFPSTTKYREKEGGTLYGHYDLNEDERKSERYEVVTVLTGPKTVSEKVEQVYEQEFDKVDIAALVTKLNS